MPGSACPAPATPSLPIAGGRLHVLVVDDDVAMRAVGALFLERLGCSSEVVPDASQAIEALAREKFDAILMDCSMPGQNGFELTALIRSGRHSGVPAEIPIVAQTAYSGPNVRSRCREAGMNSHLTKPFDVEQLAAALLECGLIVRPAERTGRTLIPRSPLVISIYLEEERTHLSRIFEALNAGAGRLLAAEAHALGGSAAAVGGHEARSIALRVERAALEANWDAVQRLHGELRAACALLRRELEALPHSEAP